VLKVGSKPKFPPANPLSSLSGPLSKTGQFDQPGSPDAVPAARRTTFICLDLQNRGYRTAHSLSKLLLRQIKGFALTPDPISKRVFQSDKLEILRLSSGT
jgi:hypothetical protein